MLGVGYQATAILSVRIKQASAFKNKLYDDRMIVHSVSPQYYLSVYLVFFVRVGVRDTTIRMPDNEDVSLSIRVMLRLRVTTSRFPDSEDGR